MISEVGSQIRYAPSKAFITLVEAFRRLGTRRAVAEELGVDESTLSRWIVALKKKGFKDPRSESRREDRS